MTGEAQPRRALVSWWRRILNGDGYHTRPPGGYFAASNESAEFGVFVQQERVHFEPAAHFFERGQEIARRFIEAEAKQ